MSDILFCRSAIDLVSASNPQPSLIHEKKYIKHQDVGENNRNNPAFSPTGHQIDKKLT
jgi:hypothetical protein